MSNHEVETIGDKTNITLDNYIIEIQGKHLIVYERKLIGKSKLFEFP